jgi:hypothetical protein
LLQNQNPRFRFFTDPCFSLQFHDITVIDFINFFQILLSFSFLKTPVWVVPFLLPLGHTKTDNTIMVMACSFLLWI